MVSLSYDMKKINRHKIERLQLLAFINSLRLHYDAYKLFKLKSYPSAYFLSILSQEELGKTLYIEYIFWYAFTENTDYSTMEKFFKGLYSHKLKQAYSIRDYYPKYKALMEKIDTGMLDKEKQNAIYVGLYNQKLSGKIIAPTTIRKDRVVKQINFVKKLYIEIINLKLDQKDYWDSQILNDYCNKKLLMHISNMQLT